MQATNTAQPPGSGLMVTDEALDLIARSLGRRSGRLRIEAVEGCAGCQPFLVLAKPRQDDVCVDVGGWRIGFSPALLDETGGIVAEVVGGSLRLRPCKSDGRESCTFSK